MAEPKTETVVVAVNIGKAAELAQALVDCLDDGRPEDVSRELCAMACLIAAEGLVRGNGAVDSFRMLHDGLKIIERNVQEGILSLNRKAAEA